MKLHQDKELNILRWAGIALAGIYAFRVLQKEGTLAGVLQNPDVTRQKAHGLINILGEQLSHHVREPATRSVIQSLGHQLVDTLIDKNISEKDGG